MKKVEMEGKVFGSLTVLRAGETNKHGQAMWVCKCDCGKEHVALGQGLRSGKIKDCGHVPRVNDFKDRTGERHGRLLVLRRVENSLYNKTQWRCRCDCGKECTVATANLRREAVHSCGCLRSELLTEYNLSVGGSNRTHGQSATTEYMLWNLARHRAQRAGLPFDLTISDVVVPKFCPVLEIEMHSNVRGARRDSSPTLDRIVPVLGYVKGNVRVISHKANRLKNNASLSELEKIFCYVKREVEEKENKG